MLCPRALLGTAGEGKASDRPESRRAPCEYMRPGRPEEVPHESCKPGRYSVLRTIVRLIMALVLAVAGVVGFAYSGLYDVSATSRHTGLVHWMLSTTSHSSIERRADGIEVPDLGDETLVRAGASDFDAMCVACHGAPGRQPDPVGQGLNPPPPDLARSASHMDPAELFWVTKNGIKMTGMPAWGATHEDDALWPVVAFLKRLPELDETQYRALLAGAAGLGHHDGGHHEHSQDSGLGGGQGTAADHHQGESAGREQPDDGQAEGRHDHGNAEGHHDH